MHPIINIASRAARQAGRLIVRAMDRIGSLKVEEKAKNDFVSEIDRAAEDTIIDTILRAYPDHGIVGEEHGTANADAEFVWIIDPLDGTSNFLAGIPHFCISIGVRRGNVLEHGLILDPVRNEEFSATRGAGARLNGRRLRVSERPRLENAIIATGIPYRMVESHLDQYTDMHRALQGSCRSIRRMGSAALDLAYVAAGRYEGCWQAGLEPWHLAAGIVLVREAGGYVSDLDGGERMLESGTVVAANDRLHPAIAGLVGAAAQPSG